MRVCVRVCVRCVCPVEWGSEYRESFRREKKGDDRRCVICSRDITEANTLSCGVQVNEIGPVY